ncbi:hypothetical protein [Clostridium sp. CTA-7]
MFLLYEKNLLNQVFADLFALKSPLSSGVLLADEVGLGKQLRQD